MISRRKFAKLSLAGLAGSMFASAPVLAVGGEKEAVVKCFGVNKCKGHNDCQTSSNQCKGHGSCKGQGFVKMSRHACDAVGGSANKPK